MKNGNQIETRNMKHCEIWTAETIWLNVPWCVGAWVGIDVLGEAVVGADRAAVGWADGDAVGSADGDAVGSADGVPVRLLRLVAVCIITIIKAIS